MATVSSADSNLHAKTRPEPDTTTSNPNRPPTIFNLSFNQTRNCFAVGTDSGFLVYSCDPFRLAFRREFDTSGGVGLIRMLNDSQLFAVVGGGPDPILPANKVMIWDDRQGRGLYDMSLRSDVRGVRLRPDRVIVVLKQKIAVYSFGKQNMHEILTTVNPYGLCEVSQGPGPMVLTCPGLHKGEIRVQNYANNQSTFIKAHESSLACLGLTQDGRYLATASTKGTIIRIYNTWDGTLLQEVRRGSEKAEIYSLAFSCRGHWLTVSSDKGTVHVFRVKLDLGTEEGDELRSSTLGGGVPSPSRISSLVKGVLPKYFSSEWSVAKFSVPVGLQHIVSFGKQKNTIMIIGMDGSFYRCEFDPVKRGDMTQLEHHNFIKPKDTS